MNQMLTDKARAVLEVIDDFYRLEVRLLQEARFEDWLELLAEGFTYRVPTTAEMLDGYISGGDRIAYFDEDKASLELRFRRSRSDMAWTDHPRSRSRYFIYVIGIEPQAEDEWRVTSNILVRQVRGETMDQIFSGVRIDVMRLREAPSLQSRTTVLDKTVVAEQGLFVIL